MPGRGGARGRRASGARTAPTRSSATTTVGAGLLVYDHISDGNTALAKYIAWSRRVVGQEAAAAIRRVPSLEEYLDHDPLHVAFSGGCAAMERLSEVIAGELGAAVKLLLTLYPKMDFALLDVLHPEASKGAGLAAVAAEQGLTRAEVMAVGDNFNDLEMLECAGTGVLMGNAEPVAARTRPLPPHGHQRRGRRRRGD